MPRPVVGSSHDDDVPPPSKPRYVNHRTMITLEVPIEHRYAVGDLVARDETRYWRQRPGPINFPPETEISVWRIIEVGYSIGSGPWYRMTPVNDIARVACMDAHGRVAKRPTPLVDLLGPVTERISTVDKQCQPWSGDDVG